MSDDAPYWVALHHAAGLTPAQLLPLIARAGGAYHAWQADEAMLADVGLKPSAIEAFLHYRDSTPPERAYERLQACGAHAIPYDDAHYPPLLRKISTPPPLLYVRGELVADETLMLAVVGTRNASANGRTIAQRFSRALAGAGVTIVSGFAEGIDYAAHQGALHAKGRTIAVLPCGIDALYPPQHAPLAQELLAQGGALVSELRLQTPVRKTNFAPRNRLISGMSLGVLVVEAPEHSGALLTVNSALEQGRDVYAVPHGIFSPQGAGTNKLIQDGAKPILTEQDLLNELNLASAHFETLERVEAVQARTPRANTLEDRLLALLHHEPSHIDDLARELGITPAEVVSLATVLELKGLAQTAGAMHYCLSHR
jgi:DNA processing protein